MKEKHEERLVALAGNPNCGKSTLFNAITGARQHVSNYPGITVEKKEGYYNLNGQQFRLVDLPGTYSLTAYSPEELVARELLVQDRPEVVVNIVDASNLERNLYLTIQFLELGIPLVVALNMMEVAASRGIEIDVDKLAQRLGLPVISTVARSGKGKDLLLQTVAGFAASHSNWSPIRISYGSDVDLALDSMERDSSAQGQVGTVSNRLSYAIALGQSQIVNNKAAESRIRDANIAEEASNLTRFSILNQSGIAALAQANQSTAAVLALLR